MAEKPSKIGFKIKLTSETSEKLKKFSTSSSNNDSDEIPVEVKKNSVVKEKESINIPVDSIEVLSGENSPQKTSSERESQVLENSDSESSLSRNLEESPGKHEKAISCESDNPYGDYAKFIHYEGEEAVYTDPSTNVEYTWSKSNNEWVLRPNGSTDKEEETTSECIENSGKMEFENDTHTYTDADGSAYIWDKEKSAWFPKVDDDFLAQYQMSYGFIDNTSDSKKEEVKETAEESISKLNEDLADKSQKRKIPEPPKWFDIAEEQNTSVYVSNLPLDITEEEFVDVMQKCGLVMRDPSSQKMKIKLYSKPNSKQLKGDALCTYIKIESVDLAEKILDGYTVRNHRIQVQKAKFQMKGDYNPALKPKKKKKKEIEKMKKMQEKLFDWRPEKFRGERSKHEKVVIIKNLFEPSLFDTEVHLILEYQQDMREECSKCGEVRRVVLYDRHPDGVAQVTMKEPEEADKVVELINGRWFGKRQLSAEIWDGKTKYKMEETDADLNKRIGKWENFLEDKEAKKKKEVEEVPKNTVEENE